MHGYSLRRCASSDYCGNPGGQKHSRSGDSSRRCNTRGAKSLTDPLTIACRRSGSLLVPPRPVACSRNHETPDTSRNEIRHRTGRFPLPFSQGPSSEISSNGITPGLTNSARGDILLGTGGFPHPRLWQNRQRLGLQVHYTRKPSPRQCRGDFVFAHGIVIPTPERRARPGEAMLPHPNE